MRLILRLILRLAPHLMRMRPSAEFITVALLLAVFLAIIGPAILHTRDQARRYQTRDQLQRLGLSLQNYHDTFLSYPANPSVPRENQTRTNEESTDPISPLAVLGPVFR